MTGMCDGRVCVVTGAARGIGRAHAEALAAEGALVVVNDVDGAAVSDSVDSLRASGADAVGHVGDASTVDGATALVSTAIDRWGRLDVVVNNAGITRDRMLWNLEESDWDDVLRVHAKSTFLTTREAARHWRTRSKAGDVVDGNVGQTNYAAAKGAIASFTLVASMELARIGVTVNAVCPTALTDMTEGVLGSTDDAKTGAPDPRWVSPAVVWLASPRSADGTGRTIVASGRRLAVAEGWHRGPTAAPVAKAEEVDAVIRPLLASAAPNADAQGDLPTEVT